MDNGIVKIAVVGGESTGKSTMSAYLAKHYQTVWVPEYAREYCEKLTEPPTWQDEINMFEGQLALENRLLPQANKILVCDTTFITVKIWSDHMFGGSPQRVIDELKRIITIFTFFLTSTCPGSTTHCAISRTSANILCRFGMMNLKPLTPNM